MATNDFQSYLSKLEDTLALYLVKKAPVLPANIKEAIVKFAPWITLVVLILTLPLVLAVLGLGALVTPFAFLGGVTAGTNFILTLLFSGVSLVLEALAIPGLFKRSKKAWNLIFYAALLGGIQNVVTFNLGGLLIGTLLSLYLLFQVKEYYK